MSHLRLQIGAKIADALGVSFIVGSVQIALYGQLMHRLKPALKSSVSQAAASKACNDVPMRVSAVPSRDRSAVEQRGGPAGRRLLVVSHPAVVSVNQEVYRELARRGWNVTIVVPSRWRHEYSHAVVHPAGARRAGGRAAAHAGRLPGPPAAPLLSDAAAASRCARSRPDVALRRGRAVRALGHPVGPRVQPAGHPVRRAVLREHRPGPAPAGALAALAGAARGRVRGRPLAQRRAPGARVGRRGRGRARPARPCPAGTARRRARERSPSRSATRAG